MIDQDALDGITDKVLAYNPDRVKEAAIVPSPTPMPFDGFTQPMLIEHRIDGEIVPQRPIDGYINATRLCQQAGKLFADYNRLDATQGFLRVLSADMGIPISGLVQSIRGGEAHLHGSWVHPQVAINLGQWLSPEFAVQVSKWVFDWMMGKAGGHMPVHVQRYLKNKSKIPPTHFSMLNEIYLNLLAPLEDYAIIPPDRMMPDISTGRMFSDFLRRKGIDPAEFPTYEHEFADSSRQPVQARLYPIEHLPDFRRYFHAVWMRQKAEKYFAQRYPEALPALHRVLQLPANAEAQD